MIQYCWTVYQRHLTGPESATAQPLSKPAWQSTTAKRLSQGLITATLMST